MGLLERHAALRASSATRRPAVTPPSSTAPRTCSFQNTTDTPVVVKTDIRRRLRRGQPVRPDAAAWPHGLRQDDAPRPTSMRPSSSSSTTRRSLPDARLRSSSRSRASGFDVTDRARHGPRAEEILRRETVVTEHRAPRPEIVHVRCPTYRPGSACGGYRQPALATLRATRSTGYPLRRSLHRRRRRRRAQNALPPAQTTTTRRDSAAPDAPHDIYWLLLALRMTEENVPKPGTAG